MIKRVTDRDMIIPLWKEAFGDTKEEIEFFLDNASYKCFGFYEGENPVSILFIIECLVNSSKSGYIYAACTLKQKRGRGYMEKLLDYCKANYGSLCLIPASDKLVEYYSSRGFDKIAEIDALSFEQSEEICEWLLEGYKLTEPVLLCYER